jgi:transposase
MIDVHNDMFRHIEELTLRNEQLEGRNRDLRTENRRLSQRVKTLENTFEERIAATIAKAVAEATKPLLERITQLENENARKSEEIKRLKSQLNKDSSNSSKPPSSNGFKHIKNNREPSSRKTGGQPGHKGHTLSIPENLEELVNSGKAEHVILDETNGAEPYVSDWEIEIKVIPVFIEKRRAAGNLPTISYGTQLQATTVYLQNIGLISLERLAEFIKEATDGLIALSQATILSFTHTAAENIHLEPYIHDLLNGEVLHVDETPVKTTERPKNTGEIETALHTTVSAYVRTYSNETTTVLTVSAHKDEESVKQDNILTRFCGVVSQDHEAKFYNYGDAHATCGAHLARDLRGMEELCNLEWAGDVRNLILEMNNHKNEDVGRQETHCDPALLCQFEHRFDELIEAGAQQLLIMKPKTLGYDELRRMVNRLRDYKDSYLLFLRDYTAPFTNNQAERDLRHCKTRQKVSGCFRSWHGLRDYCKIRSLTGTSIKRGLNPLRALRACFAALTAC